MDSKEDIRKKTNAYLKYSGLAFQMVGLVGVSVFIGLKVDVWLGSDQPYFTALFILIVFGAFMYKLYIDLMSDTSNRK